MNDAHEYVLSRAPFVVRRTARWSDCDPAGIVYTGRYTGYLLDSARLYADHVAGGDMMTLMHRHGATTPARGMSLEFRRPMAPGDVADIRYWVGAVREHSFEFRCEASAPNGDLVFAGVCAIVCINRESKRKVAIPEELRGLLMRHIKQGDK